MTTAIAALPFFGGTLSAFDPSDSGIVESTTGGTYDPAWATCSLQIGVSSTGTSPTWPVASTFWMRFFYTVGIPVSGFPVWVGVSLVRSGVGVAQLRFSWSGLATGWFIELMTLQAGVMTSIGHMYWLPNLNPFDINLVAGASGSAALYSNGSLAYSASSLNHAGFAGVDQVVLYAPINFAGAPAYFSEVICDTSSTVGRRLRTDRLNTNSAVNTGWTGSVTNINEIPTSDNSPLTGGSANLVSTFFENGLNLGTMNILARGVSARFRKEDNTGPQNFQVVIRSGATNFPSSTIVSTTVGYQASFNSWTTDPHTGAAWSDAGAASAESGVKSIT